MKLLGSLPAVVLIAAATVVPQARGQSPADAFSLLRSIDDTAARRVWPGFSLSDLPIAMFDGTQTLLFRHPSPPPEFAPLEGHAGVLAAKGRHPAVAANSTVDLNGVRTATVVAAPGAARQGTLLAYAEEVFHVFWLRRHANFRPSRTRGVFRKLEGRTGRLLPSKGDFDAARDSRNWTPHHADCARRRSGGDTDERSGSGTRAWGEG